MESIKDKVAIVGMGCSKFGERWDCSAWDLVVEAAYDAFEDAGVGPKDIQAAWSGTVGFTSGQSLSYPLKLDYIPITRVENLCGTGLETVRGATYALIAKAYDLVLCVGFEKTKDRGVGGLGSGEPMGGVHPVFGIQGTPPGRYAMAATKYFSVYGAEKKHLAMISVKSHYNGARNPKAHLRREVTLEQVLGAPIIAWPLGLFDCCGVTDGAAAAILCRTEDAPKFRKDYITVKALGNSAGPGCGKMMTTYDWVHWEETYRATQQVYQQAGIKDPRKEIDLVECHDCFSIAELMCYEAMGFCERGTAKNDIEAGTFAMDGEVAFNAGGGLKSFGHPVGASGVREIYEIYKQIQGKAEEPSRQLKNVELGIAHNQGGHPGTFICSMGIFGLPGR